MRYCDLHTMAMQASQREVQELRQDNDWLNEKLDEAAAQVQVGPKHTLKGLCWDLTV